MTKSETINELVDALCKAQGEIRNAVKDSTNPFFKSQYADLASVREAIQVPFTNNGLAYSQLLGNDEHGIVVETMLAHKSGQWIASAFSVKPVKDDPQGAGSAITYARRYALQAIAGIAADDDDGEGAHGRTHQPQAQTHRPQAAKHTVEENVRFEDLPPARPVANPVTSAPAPEAPHQPPAVPKGVKEFWPETEFSEATEVIFATVADVIEPVIGKSGKPGPYKVSIMRDDGTKFTADTFDKTLAGLAGAFGAGGEQHEIAFSTTVNGKWTNRKLEGIR